MKVKIKANKLVDKFYYMLPNNGLLDTGINNCDSRYNEAIDCAFIAVEEILFALKMDMNDPTSGSIRYWQEVKTWIQKIKDKEPDSKLSIEDMKARKYTSLLIEQLLSEITPEEMEETHQKMLEEDKKYKQMNNDKIFLVMYSTGSWDDYTEINLFATYSEDYAKAYIEKFNRILNKWKQHWKKFDDDDNLWMKNDFKNFDRFNQISDINTAWYYPIQIRE